MEPDPDDQEDELEFTFTCTRQTTSSPVSADKIFLNGQIRPSHPFELPGAGGEDHEARLQKRPPAAVREPLMRLFSREREWNSSWDSCSSLGSHSHEEDELEDSVQRRHCLWRTARGAQKGNGASNRSKKKKIDELGSWSVSKRWKVKDLVRNHGTKKVSDEPSG